MVLGTPQSDAASALYQSLRTELRARGSPLFVAMMLPIWFTPIPGGRRRQLSPDLLVAPVPQHDRTSYDLTQEGVPPALVLEIVSPESRERDFGVKPAWYAAMGVSEYALFVPLLPDGRVLVSPQLQGYRLSSKGEEYEEWEADEEGRLWSAVLELWLVVREGELRLQRGDGSLVPTPEEAERAREEEARAREQEARARQEAEARAMRLEAELARLREELARRDQD